RPWSRKLLAVIAVVLVLIVVGGGAAYVVFSTPPSPPAKVLVSGTTDDERTFDPADAYDYFSINIIQNTMAMLLTYGPGTSNLVPSILSEVPTTANGGISADALNYTLRIRPGVKFEDGSAINATVVKYSLERSMKLGGEPSFLLDAIGSVTKVDDLTVKVTLSRKWSPFVSLLAFSNTAPVHLSLTDDRFYPNLVISSGPYRLAKYIPHQRYELERNPEYFGTPAKVPKVVIVRYTTAVDLRLAIQTGEIDVAYRSLLPQDFNTLKNDANLRTLQGDSPFIRYVVFNVCDAAGVASGWCPRETPFPDVRIRRALTYAMNRTDVIQSSYPGVVSPLYSLVPEGMPFHTDAFKTRYGESQNIAQARTLLTAAGFSETNK
ncbi:MAG: ABC transporter substrate-binding protein, partial [Thermoplasmata archaeon]